MLTPLQLRDERIPPSSPQQLFLGTSQPLYCFNVPPPKEFIFIFST